MYRCINFFVYFAIPPPLWSTPLLPPLRARVKIYKSAFDKKILLFRNFVCADGTTTALLEPVLDEVFSLPTHDAGILLNPDPGVDLDPWIHLFH